MRFQNDNSPIQAPLQNVQASYIFLESIEKFFFALLIVFYFILKDFFLYLLFFTDLPEDGPTIETPRKQYQVGETADLMCIAQTSNPATNLSWYINGEPVRYQSSIEKVIPILEIQSLSIKIQQSSI